jgi:Nucleotidyl transferase
MLILEAEMAETSLVILAAGLGSRYGGLKQIDPIGPNGELLIEYSIYDALSVGIGHIVFVIQRSQEDAFREMLGTKLEGRCHVSYAYQELADLPPGNALPPGRKRPWGTGHAVLSARHAVQGPFAVINADDFYGRESYVSLAHFLEHESNLPNAYALVGFDLRKTITSHGTVSRGVCRVSSEGLLLGIDERTKVGLQEEALVFWDEDGAVHCLPETSVASMNMWAFPRMFMSELGGKFGKFMASTDTDLAHDEFFLPGAVGELAATGRATARVLPTRASWMGVTYREDLVRVQQGIRAMIEDGTYPKNLWNDDVQ